MIYVCNTVINVTSMCKKGEGTYETPTGYLQAPSAGA